MQGSTHLQIILEIHLMNTSTFQYHRYNILLEFTARLLNQYLKHICKATWAQPWLRIFETPTSLLLLNYRSSFNYLRQPRHCDWSSDKVDKPQNQIPGTTATFKYSHKTSSILNVKFAFFVVTEGNNKIRVSCTWICF